ncbi:MAG: helicase HerA domain-containing protein, partial [Gemmatimonadales bacterium]
MDGVPRTNAGAFRRGTRPLVADGRITRWSCLSRAERAGIRWIVTAGAGTTAWGYTVHQAATEQTMTGVAGAAAVGAGTLSVREVTQFFHVRNWVHPLHLVLEKPLALPNGTRPKSYIKLPRDYPTRTDVGRIILPADYSGENRSAVAALVKEKLGLTDVSVSFHMKGRTPYAEITQTPRPRAKALFAEADVRQLVLDAGESAPLIGLGPQNRVVSIDLDSESPHVLVSASTGGGKSVITRTMVAQMLHNGGQTVVLDFKRHSHKWCRGLPSVRYCRDIAEIHDALVELGREGHRRNIVVDEWDGDEREAPVGPRLGILLEEANATVSKLKRYWG